MKYTPVEKLIIHNTQLSMTVAVRQRMLDKMKDGLIINIDEVLEILDALDLENAKENESN